MDGHWYIKPEYTKRSVAASRFTCRVNKLLAALGWQQLGWLPLPPIVFGERE
jgi:hypothetical protein